MQLRAANEGERAMKAPAFTVTGDRPEQPGPAAVGSRLQEVKHLREPADDQRLRGRGETAFSLTTGRRSGGSQISGASPRPRPATRATGCGNPDSTSWSERDLM